MIVPYRKTNENKYLYEIGKMDNVLIKDVIMGVRLTVGVDEIYTVDPDDNISLQSIIQDRQELIDTRRTRKKKNAKQSK